MTPTPNIGRKIKYRKKGKGEYQEAVVICIWLYDEEVICDLSDGRQLIEAFGDEWYDA